VGVASGHASSGGLDNAGLSAGLHQAGRCLGVWGNVGGYPFRSRARTG
jgi:hypothetical protein